MTESKIELTERLRRDGRWSEATRFKDEAVKRLRAQGMKRGEAQEAAWEEMATAFPPMPVAKPDPKPTAPPATPAAAVAQPADDTEADEWDDDDLEDDEEVDEEEEWEDEDEMEALYAAQLHIHQWEQKFGVTLADDAHFALQEIPLLFWNAGQDGEIPQAR